MPCPSPYCALHRQMDLAGQWRRRGFSRDLSWGCLHCPLYQVESWIWLKRKCSFSHFCDNFRDNPWFGHQSLYVLYVRTILTLNLKEVLGCKPILIYITCYPKKWETR
jgi:hypothetical protein